MTRAVPVTTWRSAGCADLPELLVTPGITAYKVILIQLETQGLAGWPNKELSDLSLTVSYPFITLQQGYWNSISMTSLCLQTTWKIKQRRLWLLPSLHSGKTLHIQQSVHHLLFISWCSTTTIRVQSGYQELVALCLSLNLRNEVALNAWDESRQIHPFRG